MIIIDCEDVISYLDDLHDDKRIESMIRCIGIEHLLHQTKSGPLTKIVCDGLDNDIGRVYEHVLYRVISGTDHTMCFLVYLILLAIDKETRWGMFIVGKSRRMAVIGRGGKDNDYVIRMYHKDEPYNLIRDIYQNDIVEITSISMLDDHYMKDPALAGLSNKRSGLGGGLWTLGAFDDFLTRPTRWLYNTFIPPREHADLLDKIYRISLLSRIYDIYRECMPSYVLRVLPLMTSSSYHDIDIVCVER
jgi:hypothetical protein